jgi:hypothetical protein
MEALPRNHDKTDIPLVDRGGLLIAVELIYQYSSLEIADFKNARNPNKHAKQSRNHQV